MTPAQHDAHRDLERAQANWLRAYGWTPEGSWYAPQARWRHRFAPKARDSYTARDAFEMTRAEPLRYGGAQ